MIHGIRPLQSTTSQSITVFRHCCISCKSTCSAPDPQASPHCLDGISPPCTTNDCVQLELQPRRKRNLSLGGNRTDPERSLFRYCTPEPSISSVRASQYDYACVEYCSWWASTYLDLRACDELQHIPRVLYRVVSLCLRKHSRPQIFRLVVVVLLSFVPVVALTADDVVGYLIRRFGNVWSELVSVTVGCVLLVACMVCICPHLSIEVERCV
jgi:hypothetical protein